MAQLLMKISSSAVYFQDSMEIISEKTLQDSYKSWEILHAYPGSGALRAEYHNSASQLPVWRQTGAHSHKIQLSHEIQNKQFSTQTRVSVDIFEGSLADIYDKYF